MHIASLGEGLMIGESKEADKGLPIGKGSS